MALITVLVAFLLYLVMSRCLAAPFAFPSRDPEEIVAELERGNQRFVDNQPRVIDDLANLRRELAETGQQPIAAVVACSDSRVPVEDIFSQPLGRLFVVSTAGNTADVQSIGTVQYGVAHLHIPVVVVMGHTRCGAVQAVAAEAKEEGYLDKMLDPIREAKKTMSAAAEARAEAEAKEVVEKEPGDEATATADGAHDAAKELGIANVIYAAEKLQKADPQLDRLVRQGKVKLLRSMYDIKTGQVMWL